MKKGLGLMLSFLMVVMSMLAVPPGGALAAGTTYYVDSAAGNDSNNGTSSSTPWKTLTKVNSKTFLSGDKILFKAGGMWTGTLHPLGSGSSSGQVTLDMYGSGSKPVIAGNGAAAGVLLQGQEYWTINNLKVTNHASGNGKRSGIRVEAKASGITHNIFISNCEVTDVTGDIRRANDMYYCSGIHVTYVGTTSSSNHFDNVLIQNNNIHDVTTSGIKVDQSASGSVPTHTNVTIKSNTISKTGSDGIIIATTINGLVDHNALFDAGYYGNTTDTFAIAGMWTCAARNTIFQYNEVARTRLFSTDGTGFDTDFGTGGIMTFQYNYSHGNQGGFWLDCAELNKAPDYNKSVLRYNISVNDLLYVTRHAANYAELYNNVFYKSSGKLDPDMAATQTGHRYWNNIFNFQSTPNWGSATYDYNCYYPIGKAPSDAHAVTGNPAFAGAGAMGDGMIYANNYKIGPGSSCINKGMTISSNGGKDFWGSTLYNGSPDIGAHEYGGTTPPPTPTPSTATPTPTSHGGTYTFSSGYSSFQGQNNWYYMQLGSGLYSNMTWDSTNSRWLGAYTYNLIWSPGVLHPDINDTVVAWKAPQAGTVRITGNPRKNDTAGGDGVNVKIMKGGTQIWPASGWQFIAATSVTGATHDVTVNVAANDMIYFILNKYSTNSHDATTWDPTIAYQ